MDSQLKKGILNICILQLLKENEGYGYNIIKTMQEFFPETTESTLYAILRRLHKEDLTEMYYSDISNGPQRKYYRLSEKGKKCLNEYTDSWHEIEKIFFKLGIL